MSSCSSLNDKQVEHLHTSVVKRIYRKISNIELDEGVGYATVENSVCSRFGEDPVMWSGQVTSILKDPELGEYIYKKYCPVLPKTLKMLPSDAISECMLTFVRDPDLDFEFYGPFPAGVLFSTNQTPKISSKRNHGFVVNTGTLDGIHWVALFIDMVENKIEYFDSLGFQPMGLSKNTIYSIILNFIKEWPKPNLQDLAVNFSGVPIQKKGEECGVFCVAFLCSRLFGFSYKEFLENDLDDAMCFNLRNYLWNVRDVNIGYDFTNVVKMQNTFTDNALLYKKKG